MPATSEADRPDADRRDRLVFLHGFTQTHHHWHHCAHLIADRLSHRPALAFVDLPGHGLSSADRTEIVASGSALAEIGGSGTYVGYSMGGRFALIAALASWGIVERLVLIGATPGIDDEAQRIDRRRLDEQRAERVEQIGVDAFLDEWLAAAMFAGLPADPQGLEYRRRNTTDGLAHSLRRCGTGNQAGLWEHLDRIPIPVLVIAGELDTKFTEIGYRMADALPDATFVSIAGAGHAAQAERPEDTAEVIAEWLTTTEGQISPGPDRR
jgi:2-succinyl-6-hydroxy-2,4-cyclohexadiene-1-carboxylate synthase